MYLPPAPPNRHPDSRKPHLHIRALIQVDALNESDLAGLQSQNHRGGPFPCSETADAFQQGAFGYTGGGKAQLLAGSKIFGFVDTVLVFDSHLANAFLQFGLVDDEASLHIAVEAADGGCSDDALGRSAGSHNGMNSRSDDGGSDSGRKIAIANQLDARARFANIGDELFVARTVQHYDHKVIG